MSGIDPDGRQALYATRLEWRKSDTRELLAFWLGQDGSVALPRLPSWLVAGTELRVIGRRDGQPVNEQVLVWEAW